MQKRTKTIAKNTVLLYVRSIVIILLSVYTSRVLLDTLGVEDYGVYNVVGGIVAMFLSMKNVFAASVQRFINYEKGAGNSERVQEIFSTSVVIHIVIAVIFAILAECFGLFYIHRYLVLPEGMLSTAVFVFHCSVAATVVSILTIPYDAVIIANEKMDFYAYLSIGDAVLKLLIIFCLPLLPFKYLCSYAFLILCISIFIRCVSLWYSRRFPECKFRFIFKKGTVRHLTSFAGWNFFGCMSYSLIEEGSNMILNLFGGVTANAARGVAYQVRSAILSLSGNVVVASQPFITQKAATVQHNDFWRYIYLQSRAVFYLIALTVFPLYVYADEILHLWLKVVPEGTLSFVRAILIYMLVMSFQKPLDLAFKAYNRLPLYQMTDALILLLTLPCIYIVLKNKAPLYMAFVVFSIVRIVDYIAILIIARHQLHLKILQYLREVLLPSAGCLMIMFIVGAAFVNLPGSESVILLCARLIIMIIVTSLLLYLLILKRAERDMISGMMKNILRKFYRK